VNGTELEAVLRVLGDGGEDLLVVPELEALAELRRRGSE
jgi:hypothetical protein